jgi:predicted membrane chloride channel (bestrophin family)
MIKYHGGAYGLQILLRLHGSAVFKSSTPALLSTAIYVIMLHTYWESDTDILGNPYPMGTLMVAFSFLLTFKMSFSYNRYWEAVTAVHQMHSKWLDVGMDLTAFHLQSSAYKKPPSFGHHPEAKSIQRERERLNMISRQELEEKIEQIVANNDDNGHASFRGQLKRWTSTKRNLNIPKIETDSPALSARTTRADSKEPVGGKTVAFSDDNVVTRPQRSTQKDKLRRVTSTRIVHGGTGSEQASLFLQEAAHLLSLLSAVAFSTLRNDLEQAESPLATFLPGSPWPCVDPDEYSADVRKDWTRTESRCFTVMCYLIGRSRNQKAQTLYNAARPFRVVGGVSDAEIEMLQAARGPLAKVALCSMWLQEFISREYMAGSTGNVAPPIISRLYQCVSDGMLGYNQARKIAYIPFPFPHAQITALFILVVVAFVPVLMLSFVNNEAFGAVLNCLTVMCFTGLNEVSRELENPFQNVPNGMFAIACHVAVILQCSLTLLFQQTFH